MAKTMRTRDTSKAREGWVAVAGMTAVVAVSLLAAVAAQRGGGVGLDYGALLVLLAATAVALVVVLFAPCEPLGLSIAVAYLLAFVLVPTFGAPLYLKAGLALILAISSAIYALRFRLRPTRDYSSIFLIAVLVYAAFFGAAVGSQEFVYATCLHLLYLVPFVYVLAALSISSLRRFVNCILGVAAVESVWSVLTATAILPLPWGVLGNDLVASGQQNNLLPMLSVRGSGSFAHPIPCAMFLVFGLLLLLGNPWWSSRAKLGMSTLLFVGIIFTGTRSALAVALLVVALTYILRRSLRVALRWGIAASFAVVIGILWSWLGSSRLLELAGLNSISTSVSYTQRMDTLYALKGLLSFPLPMLIFGSRPDDLSELPQFYFMSMNGVFAIDNQWISLLAKTGLISIVLVAIALVILARRSRFGLLSAIFLVALGFVYSPLDWNSGILLWAVLMCRSLGVVYNESQSQASACDSENGSSCDERSSVRKESAEVNNV